MRGTVFKVLNYQYCGFTVGGLWSENFELILKHLEYHYSSYYDLFYLYLRVLEALLPHISKEVIKIFAWDFDFSASST